MARTFTIVSVCDVCLDEGRPDVPGISIDAMIGDAAGTLDLCRDHRALVEQVRQLILKSARPIDSDRADTPHASEQPPAPAAQQAGARAETQEVPEPRATRVNCGLCDKPVALKYRAMHARRAHGMRTGQIRWTGNLPYPCPERDCKYSAASPAGRAQHIRREHTETNNEISKAGAA